MAIHTGMFNKKVTFFRSEREVSPYGARRERIKINLFSCYAYVSNIRGAEFWESRRLSERPKMRIRVRWHPKIDSVDTINTFVNIDGTDYNILSMEDVLGRRREFYFYLEGAKDEY